MTKRNPHLDELKSRAAAFRPNAKPRRQELSTSTRLAQLEAHARVATQCLVDAYIRLNDHDHLTFTHTHQKGAIPMNPKEKTITLSIEDALVMHEQLMFRVRELEEVLQEALRNGDASHADSLMRTIPRLKDAAAKLID